MVQLLEFWILISDATLFDTLFGTALLTASVMCGGNSSSTSQSMLQVFNSPYIIVDTVYIDLLSPRKGNKSRPSYNTT